MVNFHSKLIAALEAIGIDVHYEMVLHRGLKTPCISYMEINNYDITDSQYDTMTIGYSRITYQIKVWANNIADIQKYSLEVDKAVRQLGLKRISSGELYDNNSSMIQKVMNYEGLTLETF